MDDDVDWVNRQGVPELVGCLIDRLVTCRPDDPIDFLMRTLEQWRATATSISSEPGPPSEKITILHFNDVYNIEPQESEPVGGAARFVTMVQSLEDPLVLFSGDAFNPSTMSTCTKGKQMPPTLNAIGVKVACIGNHDFDHGIGPLVKLLNSCDFPWLLSNVFLKGTNEPLGQCHMTHIIDWKGHKIGLMGLVEYEWLATLAAVDENEVEFVDFVVQGNHLAASLREQGCSFIIALTHMRVPNDELLAHECKGIDLVLGGHDHHYEVERKGPNGLWVVKSGTDFREATEVTVLFGNAAAEAIENDPSCGEVEKQGGFYISTRRLEVDSQYAEHPATASLVNVFVQQMGATLDKIVAFNNVELDSRFEMIRRQETNCSNFIADAVRGVTNADVVILNSGTLRADRIFPSGPLRIRDISSLLPMVDNMVVLEIRGEQLLEALENGVSKYPALEGRFPMVSGLQFAFDPSRPPGSRVLPDSVLVHQELLCADSTYTLATKEYIAGGKDGYDVFKGCEILVESELLPPLQTMIHRYLFMLSVISGLKPDHAHAVSHALPSKMKPSENVPRGRSLSRVNSVASFFNPRGDALQAGPSHMWSAREFGSCPSFGSFSNRENVNPVFNFRPGTPVSSSDLLDLTDQDRTRCNISPEVEGRITILG